MIGREQCRADRAVTLSPHGHALERERVEKMAEVDGGVSMIGDRQLALRRGASISTAVGEDQPMRWPEHGSRVVERHRRAAPSAVQADQRPTATRLFVPETSVRNI